MKPILMFLLFLSGPGLIACPLTIDSVSNVTFNWDGNEQTITGNWQVSRGQSGNNDCRRFHLAFDPALQQ